jgi:hypothetical protein
MVIIVFKGGCSTDIYGWDVTAPISIWNDAVDTNIFVLRYVRVRIRVIIFIRGVLTKLEIDHRFVFRHT